MLRNLIVILIYCTIYIL